MVAPYLLHPIIVLGLFAIAAGPASTLMNLRRAEFSAETMVHGAFPGIVVGMTLGGRDVIIPGGTMCAALVAAALTVASHKPRHSEAMTAVLLTAFFSLDIVISLRIRDMSGQLEPLMLGRLLGITLLRMRANAMVLVLTAALLTLIWHAQVAVAFDREAPRVSGIPVTWIDIAFNAALGATVAAAPTMVGVLLVVGYLIVPGAFDRLLTAGLRLMALLAGTCALVGGWVGLGASLLHAPHSLSPQACVALGVLVYFAGAYVLHEIHARRVCPKPAVHGTARETSAAGGEEQQRLPISSRTQCST